MKLLKSKFATAFVLAGLMFGMLSFSTTPVSAQDTFSGDAVMEEELAYGAVARFLGKQFIKGAAWALGYVIGENLIGGSATLTELPEDSLDQGF